MRNKFCKWIGYQHSSELIFTRRRIQSDKSRHDGVEFKVGAFHQTVSEATVKDDGHGGFLCLNLSTANRLHAIR